METVCFFFPVFWFQKFCEFFQIYGKIFGLLLKIEIPNFFVTIGVILIGEFSQSGHKKEGLANPTKGFLRLKTNSPYLNKKIFRSRHI
jgi:hypothetical protein